MLTNLAMNFHEISIDMTLNENDLYRFNENDTENYIVGLPVKVTIGKLRKPTNGIYYCLDSN